MSHDQDTIQAEVRIAPPERVFRALTDPRQLLEWWGQQGMYRCTHWSTDVRPGGQWRSEGVGDRDGKPFHVGGEYVEVYPPRVLAYPWIASWTAELKTVVRWELEPASGGTLVRLRHSGFAQTPELAKNHYAGWQHVIGWMQAFVEKGTTVGDRPSPV